MYVLIKLSWLMSILGPECVNQRSNLMHVRSVDVEKQTVFVENGTSPALLEVPFTECWNLVPRS